MATVSFAGFRAFLEKYQPVSDKDKDAEKDKTRGKDKPMDYLGGLQRELGPVNSRTLAKIVRTTPEIQSGANIDGIDAKYVPVKFDPGLRGGSMEAIPIGDRMMASKDGYDLTPDQIVAKLKHRHLKRKPMVGALERGWGPAVAAAAGGGAAPGGAAPPPM